MYVVRDPFTDGRANYEPVKTRFAGVLAFFFDAGASRAGHRVNVMNRIIRDFMCRGVVTCSVNANAAEVARIMFDNDVSALVVIDECLNACGIISKTDLLRSYGKDLSLVSAEDIMTSDILTVSPETLIHEAVQLMLEHGVHQLVIITHGGIHRRPVAIFTSGDAVELMAGEVGRRSEAQIRCSECLRRLLSIDPENETKNSEQ
jgi:CBS domain-containing protein